MALQTQEVGDLVDFLPEGFLVTSFYLNVDAVQLPARDAMLKSFDSTIHEAESERKELEKELSHEAAQSLRADLEKIRQFVTKDFNRDDTKGLGIFSCSAKDFWHVVQLPDPVESRVVFAPRPQLARIASFLSRNKPAAILVTDRQHARIFTFDGEDAKEWTNFNDFVPRHSQAGGWSQTRYQRRSDSWARHHIDHAAELVLRLKEHRTFDRLILGVDPDAQSDLEHALHPYVKDAVIGRINASINGDAAEIIARARALLDQVQQERLENLMTQIREYAGAKGRGTVGLEDTLKALNEQNVHILLVQQGYRQAGAECPNCGVLLAEGRDTCPACGHKTMQVDNIIESAIQRALELGATVEVATEQEKLAPIGYIGAITYY